MVLRAFSALENNTLVYDGLHPSLIYCALSALKKHSVTFKGRLPITDVLCYKSRRAEWAILYIFYISTSTTAIFCFLGCLRHSTSNTKATRASVAGKANAYANLAVMLL